jgi:hypothetical protein
MTTRRNLESIEGGEGRPPPPPPPEPKTFPLHPLFVTSKSAHEPLFIPIGTIDVHRKTKAGKYPMLCWVPSDDLPDENAVLERFGPGEYLFVARDEGRTQVLRRAFVDLGEVPEEEEQEKKAKSPGDEGSALKFVMGMLEREREDRKAEREREERRADAQRERDDARSADQMKMLTGFAQGQIDSMRTFTTALASSKNGNSGSFKEFLEAHETMQANAHAQRDAIADQVREEVQATKGDVIETFVESLGAGMAAKMGAP